MKRRFRNSSRQIGRLGLRTLLVSATIGTLAFIAISLFLIHFLEMKMEKQLVINGYYRFQNNCRFIDTLPGSTLQLLSGIKISAKGAPIN
ncbi:MAG: hypothetical protein IPN13_07060 [Bacteroidetes bacterium]|nr:hypothetical protein [Bacteroidota bacterium]